MTNFNFSKTILTIAVSAALSGAAIASSHQIVSAEPERSGQLEFDTSVKNKGVQQEFPNYFIVQLASAPLGSVSAAMSNSEAQGNKLDLTSAAAEKHSNVLAAERAEFASTLAAAMPSAQIERHYDTVFNGVVVTSKDDVFEQLKKLEGVTAVYREEMYYEQMDASLDLIKAKQVWEQLGGNMNAGKGVKVAIIDGGIRPENPMFADAGFTAPSSRPNNDYCATVEPAFCNNKLIAARFSTPTFATVPQEYMSPLGNGGHGTHVAGTAVGVPTTIKFNGSTSIVPKDADGKPITDGFSDVTVSGVAPGAYLMAYKALYQVFRADGTVTGSGSNIMLLEALDWAVKDGADVINNSWGGGAGGDPASSPYRTAFKTAEEAGVVVVTAAGNDGPGAQTVGCPGCIESGITVASTTHGRFFANSVTFGSEAPMLAITGSVFDTTLTADVTAPVVNAAVAAPANQLACTPFPADTFKDSIALISRGTCSFTDKINNAQAAGAKAVIMVQNNDGQPTSMSNPGVAIPSVMITRADGAKIAADLVGSPGKTATISRFGSRLISGQFADNMSDFSSRGPDGDNNILKPDMGAPGSSILSATSPDAFTDKRTFQLNSGTSMASPHVAGAAAVMQQMFPKWTAVEIKTALTSTAVNGLKKEDSTSATTPFDIGAGRLDLSRAVKAAATFDKPSFAQNPCVINCSFTRTIRNMTDKEVTWTGSLNFTDANTKGSLNKTSVTLKPYGTAGDSAEFMLTVDGSMSTYGAWAFGNVLWKSSVAGTPDATMPIAVRIANTADSSTLATSSSTVLKPGEPTQVTSSFGNKTFDAQVTMTMTAPAGTKVVANSESSTLTNATEFLLDANTNLGRISWTGTTKKPSVSLVGGSVAGFNLKDNGIGAATCAGECDDNVISYNLPTLPITFNGSTYTRVHVSTNGFIQLSNSATPPSAAAANLRLPNATAATNILAPFWTDLDLAGGSDGGGTLHAATVNSGGRLYLVIEWNNAQVWQDPSNSYTFQVWMATNGAEDIFYSYGDLGATPEALTVGVQDITRTLGTSRFYVTPDVAASGSAPTSNSGVDVATVSGGQVNVKYSLENTGALELGTKDTITVNEDAVSDAADVLANEKATFNKIINVEISSGTEKLKAVNKAAVGANGALSKVAIVTQAANGVAKVEADKVVYTPKANFNGKDTFTYTAEDTTGAKLVPTTVEVTVAPVNDAPTVAGGTFSANEGATVTLNANGTDIDGDTLTYTWTQKSGPAIAITATTGTVSVTAPTVTANASAVFEVVANDGKIASAPATVTLNIADVPAPVVQPEKKKSSGSFGWMALLLLPVAIFRRRKQS